MAKKNLGLGEMVKLGCILVCYAVVSCAILAVVNSFTSVKIEQNRREAANKAMREVFVDADTFDPVTSYEGSSNSAITVSDFYIAKKDGNITGGVIQVTGPTYDTGKIIVGVDKNGIITGMQILELSDSPGFGLKANDPGFKLSNGSTFYGQFTGKDSKLGFKANETFDAISGATITSKAIGDLLEQGCNCINTYLEGQN